MNHSTTVDMQNFHAALTSLAARVGTSFAEVARYEAGKIFESAIRYTPAATVQSIKGNQELGKVQVLDGKKYWMDNRYPQSLWNRLLKARKTSLQRKLRSRGLAKKSWFELALVAGMHVSAPAFVKKAIAGTGKEYPSNYTVAEGTRGAPDYRIEFWNAQPTVQGRGPSALSRAIRGRMRYFENNVRRGVFQDAQAVARAYPGLTVTK
jgi:hypothetical protein